MTPVSVIQKYNTIYISQGPFNIVACMIATDILTLILSVSIAVVCKVALNPGINLTGYVRLWPFLFVFIAVYAAVGLYSGVTLSPPDELRRATWSSGLVFIVLGAATVSFRGAATHFTWTLFLAMALSIILLPLLRAAARRVFARESWWGYPAVIFGSGPSGRRIVEALLAEPETGLKPVIVVDDNLDENVDRPRSIHGVPVIGGDEIGSVLLGWEKSAYAVVPLPEIQNAGFLSLIERPEFRFSRILVMPDVLEFSSLWVNPKSVGGMLGLEVCQQIFDPGKQWAKRALDLTLILMGSIVCIPLCLLVALWIRWDSPGPIFFSQRRIGFGGREFRAWKFRSMIQDAEHVLEQHLAADPALREEWERDHKLRNDPRLTRAGRFLRRTSLDELPQLWNVWKGEMSLVGPRPIVDAEVARYGASFDLYTKVKGGITGLWQVSGRTDTTYDQRVQLDRFYVRNWSVWLDLCILFRTIGIVFIGKGAY